MPKAEAHGDGVHAPAPDVHGAPHETEAEADMHVAPPAGEAEAH
jgi:hypothetical protein